MLRILILSFAFIFVDSSTFAQKKNLVLTNQQNITWFDSLQTLSIGNQLLSIKERILTDTNVYVRKSYPDRIKINDSLGNRVYGDGKPTLIIGGYPMTIDNKTPQKKIISLANLLTEKYIKEVFILKPNDPKAAALYGSPSQFGIIVMAVHKKAYSKLFSRIGFKPNY